MRIVIALGGNALQKPGEPLTMANQQRNVRIAATALAPIIGKHDVIITHGSGPQIGLLAYQAAALNGAESTPSQLIYATPKDPNSESQQSVINYYQSPGKAKVSCFISLIGSLFGGHEKNMN